MGRTLFALGLASTLAAVTACSDDDSGGLPGAGGSGGDSGSGGTATGGSGGGSSGSGGSSAGGTGGSAGSSGSGGSAGSSGSGGSGGFVEPQLLSETGLYEDIASEALAEGVMPFRPRFQLWSDGAAKRRFVYLPPGAQIDTTDMDYWEYPPGTKVWKEFTRDGVRVETRLLQKIDDRDWYMVAFRWNDDLTDAEAVPDGEMNARGTQHDIPSQQDCAKCHDNMEDVLLGFSAIQLSHDLDPEGVNLARLIADDRLTSPPAGPFELPGTETAQNVLGYLHANCGHCHNPESVVSITIDMQLWLSTEALDSVETTRTYLTTVGQNTTSSTSQPWDLRIVPGNLEESALYQRLIFMPEAGQQSLRMPPVATEIVDTTAVDQIADWIESLEP